MYRLLGIESVRAGPSRIESAQQSSRLRSPRLPDRTAVSPRADITATRHDTVRPAPGRAAEFAERWIREAAIRSASHNSIVPGRPACAVGPDERRPVGQVRNKSAPTRPDMEPTQSRRAADTASEGH